MIPLSGRPRREASLAAGPLGSPGDGVAGGVGVAPDAGEDRRGAVGTQARAGERVGGPAAGSQRMTEGRSAEGRARGGWWEEGYRRWWAALCGRWWVGEEQWRVWAGRRSRDRKGRRGGGGGMSAAERVRWDEPAEWGEALLALCEWLGGAVAAEARAGVGECVVRAARMAGGVVGVARWALEAEEAWAWCGTQRPDGGCVPWHARHSFNYY